MSAATKVSLPVVTGNPGNSPHVRAGRESYRRYRQLPVTDSHKAAK
jgi:hypothetical protein